jgi:hypothetical protein
MDKRPIGCDVLVAKKAANYPKTLISRVLGLCAGGRLQPPGRDDGVQLIMDDPGIMMREVPNQATQLLGVRVGQVMSTASGTKLVLEPYRTGEQMAAACITYGRLR